MDPIVRHVAALETVQHLVDDPAVFPHRGGQPFTDRSGLLFQIPCEQLPHGGNTIDRGLPGQNEAFLLKDSIPVIDGLQGSFRPDPSRFVLIRPRRARLR